MMILCKCGRFADRLGLDFVAAILGGFNHG